ncbi:MAG: hypothetical protein HC884_03275 [Chloroflexaceae bacterium]|nr:hypothetical protein [Chloroflexaceae bacterium]
MQTKDPYHSHSHRPSSSAPGHATQEEQTWYSSAGLTTQRLSAYPQVGASQEPSVGGVPPEREEPAPNGNGTKPISQRNTMAALVLIGAGVLMLLGRILPSGGPVHGGMVLLTIASCFLFFALWKHVYGLLIPGCILGGLSVGVMFGPVTGGASVLWGLALGFMAILFVGRTLFKHQSQWPIYPAVPLFAVGIVVAMARLPGLLAGGLIWLPLLLIGAGFYLGWKK